jgi:hypothetical protein
MIRRYAACVSNILLHGAFRELEGKTVYDTAKYYGCIYKYSD